MYSAVLMLALTAGNESIDFGKARCHGCSTTCTTSTTTAVAYSCSASTVRHGLFNRCHGCTTTCTASSCTSSGGLFHRRSCSCPPACTVYTCSTTSTTVTPMVPIDKKKEMPKPPEKIDAPKKDKASLNVPATIVVSLPADARLIVDGTPTSSTSDRRTLVTPVLENGMTYVYTMQAEITRDGRVQTQSQQVTVRGGETSNVQFNFSAQSVASR